MAADFCSDVLKLLRSKLQLGATEVGIALRVHGDKMDVGMGYFQAEHHLCHLLAREGFAHGQRHTLGKKLELGELVVVHVEDVVDFPAWNDQRVAFLQGVDVEKGVELVALGTLVAGNFASGDT